MNDTPLSKITFDGSIYREHLILYMDILGYSDVMLDGEEEDKQAILELQSQLLTFDKDGYWEEQGEKYKAQPLTTLLSDTFVCSYPMEDLRKIKNNDFGVKAALMELQRHSVRVHRLLLKRGMLIRGAVVLGNIVNHNGMAYGEGLAKAAELEKGKPPFIYYDSEVIELMQKVGTSAGPFALNECIFNCPETGAPCYDWLKDGLISSLIKQYHEKFFVLLDEEVQQINKKLISTQGKENAHKKWLDLARHFDKTIKEHNARYASSCSSEPAWIYNGEQIRFL